MFIFDLDKKTFEVLGESNEMMCKECNNKRKFKYVKEKSWISIASIPIISYKSRKLLICPVCNSGYTVDRDIKILPSEKNESGKNVEKEKKSAYEIIKKKLDAGEITKNEYIRMCNILNMN